jgi:pimeloyl-ACP methyl ester carboxylesterase
VATILAYLGPWAGSRSPSGISRELVEVPPLEEPRGASSAGAEPLSAVLFGPAPATANARGRGGPLRSRLLRRQARPHGVYVVLHGLHYAGPDDPRMDRFCRILAAAGHWVVAPLLPRSLALLAHDDTTIHAERALAYARTLAAENALPPPALFTISFGSLPGIRVAAGHPRTALSSLVLFGGYGRFLPTLRFALTGEDEHGRIMTDRDPLNGPAVFINLLPYLEGTFRRDVLTEAFLEVAKRTWGRPPMREPETRRVVVEAVARAFVLRDEDERPLFLAACGFGDATSFHEAGLKRASGQASEFAEPANSLKSLKVPTFILHGRGDDVIPVGEATALRAMLPIGHPTAVLLSGMHGHTGSHLPRPAELWAELRTALRVAVVLASAASEPEAALAAIGAP